MTSADLTFEQELKQSCSQIKNYASQGKKRYEQKQFAKALVSFEQQAAWTAFCYSNDADSGLKLNERDVVLAFNNVGLSYAKLNKPQWARAWYISIADSGISQFNLRQLPAPKNNKKITGTYVQHAGFGAWNTLTVKQLKNHYAIQYEGLYMGIRSLIYGPNLGSFETTMPLNKSRAQFHEEDCKIYLSFGFDSKVGQQVVLKQTRGDSACGFGHNVSADGMFIKVE